PDEYPNKLIVSSFSVFDPYKVNKFQNKFMSIVKMVEETKYVYCGPLEGNFSSLDTVVKPIIKALFINKSDTNKVNGYLKLLDKVGCIEPIFLEINIRKLRTTNARAFDERFDSEARELVEEYCRIIEELPRIASRNKRNKADHILIEVSHFDIQLLSLYERMVELEIDSCIKDIWFLNRQGQGVPLSRMSSGEVTLLYRFLPLVLEMEDNSIVLIDEPETHLHPKWIQEFIKYLVELFQDYNSHFFIATHSPIIASDVPMECLIGLKKESGRIVPYFPLDRTLGGYSNDLLRDVFNLHEQFGRFSSEEIQLIRTLLESKNEENIKIAKRIYDDLSTTYEKYQLYETYRDLLRDNNVEN
ncbi:AAA family ATPase, partial [Priestia megaterium]|uniref:AAA family ATPase n=1 Tax=Priestia megaterium TaxID=1404 RepID=UPI002FFF01F7